MSNKKSLIRFWAWNMALTGLMTFSVLVHAESEGEEIQISEQPVVQESVTVEESPAESYDNPEPSYAYQPEPEPSYISEPEPQPVSSYVSESQPESSYIPEPQPQPQPQPEPSYYYGEPSETYENPFPWAQESTDYYYEPEYSQYYENSYYYSQPDTGYYYQESSYEYQESDEYWYENETTESEEEEESSVIYQETSVDSSELTSKDWENLKNSLSSDMKLDNSNNKSSDAAVREIKDNTELTGNDDVNYLMWGLILIGIGVVILVFIISSTVYTKRQMSEDLSSRSKKMGGSTLSVREKTDKK